MKKLIIISIVVFGLVFIAGCLGDEKTTKSSLNSQSSEYLINPINLINGYHSSNYKTYATSKMNSFDGQIESTSGYISMPGTAELYEGPIPIDKKRIQTSFTLGNDDNSVIMNIIIYEFDSGLKYKESLSKLITNLETVYEQVPEAVIETDFEAVLETDFIGDYSFLIMSTYDVSSNIIITFSYNKYGIIISMEDCKIEDLALCKNEGLKVAKAIKSNID